MSEINFAFARADQILPLFHVLSAIFLVAYQFGVVMSVKNMAKYPFSIENITRILAILDRYKRVFLIIFCINMLTGILVSMSDDYKFLDPMVAAIIATKVAIGAFMLMNFFYIHYKILSLKNSLKNANKIEINEYIIIITSYFIPLNLVLGVLAVYLGMVIGGF